MLKQSMHALLVAEDTQTLSRACFSTGCLTCVQPRAQWYVCTCVCAGERAQPLHAAPCISVRCLRRFLRRNRRAAGRRRSARAARSGSASRRMCRPRRAVPRSLARCASSRRCPLRACKSQPVFCWHPQWDGAQMTRLGAEPWVFDCGQISMLKHAAKETCSLARHGRKYNRKGARLLLAGAHSKASQTEQELDHAADGV